MPCTRLLRNERIPSKNHDAKNRILKKEKSTQSLTRPYGVKTEKLTHIRFFDLPATFLKDCVILFGNAF